MSYVHTINYHILYNQCTSVMDAQYYIVVHDTLLYIIL